MKIREYSAPLTVLAAGVLGFSLICLVSAAALSSPTASNVPDIEAQDVVDAAIANPISTVAALTVVGLSDYLPTPDHTDTATPSPTFLPSSTPTARIFITWTPPRPTKTPDRQFTATSVPTSTKVPSVTPSRTPSRTPTPTPTDTDVPTFTNTPRPTSTDTDTPTPIPPSNTPTDPPTETNTPEPPATSTPGDLGAADPTPADNTNP